MPVDEVQNAADIGLFERVEKEMVRVLLATGIFEAPAAEPRYREPAMPMLIIAGVTGYSYLFQRFRSQR